jgi:hypothetical protein
MAAPSTKLSRISAGQIPLGQFHAQQAGAAGQVGDALVVEAQQRNGIDASGDQRQGKAADLYPARQFIDHWKYSAKGRSPRRPFSYLPESSHHRHSSLG